MAENLQMMRKAELQEIVRKYNGDPTGLSKSQLIDLIKANTTNLPAPQEEIQRGSEPWTQSILDMLLEEELIEGRPKVEGLRRIFPEVMGPILSCECTVIDSPKESNNDRATCQCRIEYLDLDLSDRFEQPMKIVVQDVADSYYGNSEFPFSRHLTATAATMAEGRCLRKALRLSILTEEESNMPDNDDVKAQQDDIDDKTPAKDNQKMAINRIAERANINVVKLLKSLDSVNTNEIENISSREAKVILRVLNRYQGDVSSIPAELMV